MIPTLSVKYKTNKVSSIKLTKRCDYVFFFTGRTVYCECFLFFFILFLLFFSDLILIKNQLILIYFKRIELK